MEIPHSFADPGLLALALTHSSTAKSRDNERMEFLGDAVLDLIVAEQLFRDQPDLDEGELTERKAWVVSRRSLARAARRMQLGRQARIGRGLDRETLSRSVLANLYEAVLGAVYLDAGLAAARAFALETLATELARANSRENRRPTASPKQLLQEWCQKEHHTLPRYELLETRGEAHAKAFLMRVHVGRRAFPPAWGRSRKDAESWAAREALLELDLEA